MTNNKGVCITMPLCNWTHRYNFNFIRTCASSAEIITTHVACAARIKSLIGSRTVHMRLGHECNASGRSGLKDANGDPKPDPNGSFYRYPWVFLNPADNSFANEVDYKGAWNRIASIYKASMGDQIQMVWNHILIHNAYLRVNRYWPGDDVVDVLSCDLYDSGEPEFMDNATTWNAWLGDYNPTLNGGSAKGLNGFVEFARLKGVKMAIDEWAPMNSAKNVTDGCNNNFFPGAMFNWLQANAADIAYESYYNLNSGGHQICPQATATYLTRSSAAYKAAWTP
jgi:hypothetical protein